jgi:two-component system, OmpR family, sensor histidine kinase ResE
VTTTAPADRTQPAIAKSPAEADLDAYAAQAAHQLGEAVALLRGYLFVLEQRGERDPELEDALRGLGAGTERAQRFVDDLLDLAASGRAEPVSERVALDEALDTARQRLASELTDAAAEVRVADPLPVARADRELIARLMTHLLRVSLSAGARAVDVEGEVANGMVRVELRDDGTPASGEPFVPFAKARGRGPLVGAGVGLIVSRRIVERHGGTIALHRDDDGTTSVTFTLPSEG